jgi:allantoin racemase
MRILLLNPNMSSAMTHIMANVAHSIASDNVEIVPVTAPKGFPYISSRAEAQIAGAFALETIAEHEHDVDAVIIAAFGDPGLKAAREQFNLPIVGMAQASIMTAALLGEQFSIVTFTPLMSRWYVDSVEDSGLSGKFLGVRTPDANKLDAFAEQSTMETELLRLVNQSVSEDRADVVILGGAPLAGMASKMQSQVNALLLDPISSAVVLAESLVKVSDKSAFGNRHSRPAFKESTGLSQALTEAMKGNL